MFNKLKIGQKFILSFFFISIGPLLTVVYLNYANSTYQLKQKITDSFSALNSSRAAYINYLLQLRLEQARELAGSFLTRQLTENTINEPWLVHKMQGQLDSVYSELMRASNSPYRNIDKLSDIESIGMVDMGGHIIADTDQSLIGVTVPAEQLELVRQNGTFFGGLRQQEGRAKTHLFILDKIRSWETGEFAGAILLWVKGAILNQITNDHTGLGQSGENYIINHDLLMITQSRFEKDSVLRVKVDTPASRECFQGKQGTSIYESYHGNTVLGVVKLLPDQDWCMISEMDTREAFASVVDLRNLSLLLVTSALFLMSAFLFMMKRKFITPIIELRNASHQVGEGNLDVYVKPKSEDELGELTHAFNSMSVRLKEDKQALEEQKQDLQKVNKELDSFVYTASHDLRAPLRGIASFATFLEEDYQDKLDDEGKDHLKEIRQGAERLSALIEDLLLLSRISRIKNPYEMTNIQAVLQQVSDQLKFDIEDKKVNMVIAKNLPTIMCDPIKIKTAILNLVNNAIKFSSKENIAQPRVEIGYNETLDQHEFFVKDNGIGIDPQYHDKVFGLFRKLHTAREYEGTGAGLSIVQRIVEDHGGKIWIRSQEGQGAVFHFSIPKNLTNTKKKS